MVKYTNFHCDACENGIVIEKKTLTATSVKFQVSDCNICKKPFGLKRLSQLKQVTNEIKDAKNE